MKKTFFTLLIIFSLLILPSSVFANANQDSVSKAIKYLGSQQTASGRFDDSYTLSDFDGYSSWVSMDFESAGTDIETVKIASGDSLLKFLQNNPPTSSNKATDWEKRILAIAGAGQSVSNFNGTDYLTNLKTYYNNNQIGDINLVNDDWYGLLALIASNESSTSTVMIDTLNFILVNQNTDGGFNNTVGQASDPDDTAAALMSLVAAKNYGLTANLLNTEIEDAKNYLIKNQNCDGGYLSGFTGDNLSNLDSTSLALMALSSVGMYTSPQALRAQMFIRSLQQADNSFSYNNDTTYGPLQGDLFDTRFAVLALQGAVFPTIRANDAVNLVADTTDYAICSTPTPTPTPTDMPSPTPTSTSSSNSSSNQTITPTPTPSIIPTTTPTQTLLAENQLVPIQSGPTQAVLGSSITTDVLSPTPALSAKVSPTSLNWSFLSKFLIGLGVILFLTCGILVLKRYKQLN